MVAEKGLEPLSPAYEAGKLPLLYSAAFGANDGTRTHTILLSRDFPTTLCYHSRITAL